MITIRITVRFMKLKMELILIIENDVSSLLSFSRSESEIVSNMIYIYN